MVDKVDTAGMLTQAAYAEHRKSKGLVGGTRAAGSQAVKEGRIKTYDGLIDPEQADLQWARNTRARATSTPMPAARAATSASSPIGSASTGQSAAADPLDYMREKTRLAAAQASTAELELARLRGELTDTKAVHQATISAFRLLRDMLQGVGRTLAPKVAGLSDTHEIKRISDDEIRAVLDTFVSRTLPDAMRHQAGDAGGEVVVNV